MVPNRDYSDTIGHHINHFYGAQWGLNKRHWAPYKPFLWCPMAFEQIPLGTIEMVYMVPNGISLNPIGHHKMVYMVPNGV